MKRSALRGRSRVGRHPGRGRSVRHSERGLHVNRSPLVRIGSHAQPTATASGAVSVKTARLWRMLYCMAFGRDMGDRIVKK